MHHRRRCGWCRTQSSPVPCLGEGQADVKHCAAGTAFCRQLAAVRFHDGMCNAEAHAHAILLRRKERLEEPLHPIGRYSGAGIADRDKGLPSTAHDLQVISRTPFGISAMASIPLTMRFKITCCSWTWSPFTRSRSWARLPSSVTLRAAACADVICNTSRTTSLRSTSCGSKAPCVRRRRNRLMTSAARWSSRLMSSIIVLISLKSGDEDLMINAAASALLRMAPSG